jgi:hypothetical protein
VAHAQGRRVPARIGGERAEVSLKQRGQVPAQVSQLPQPRRDVGEQVFLKRLAGGRFGAGRRRVADGGAGEAGDDRLLRREVIEEGAAGDAGGLGDVPRRGGLEAFVGEEPARRAQDPLPVAALASAVTRMRALVPTGRDAPAASLPNMTVLILPAASAVNGKMSTLTKFAPQLPG